MTLFTSPRERNLWLATAVVVIAIYVTLGQTPTIALALQECELLDEAFIFALLLVVTAVLLQWIRTRPGKVEMWVAVGIASAYLFALLRTQLPTERSHMFEYSLVAALIFAALRERKLYGRNVPAPALLALAITIAIGWIDEIIQLFLPNRVYDIRDVFFNAVAATMAITATLALRLARERFDRLANGRRSS